MTTPRALAGLRGTRVGGRFELTSELAPGFVTSRYEAVYDAERCLVSLVEPGLAAAPLGETGITAEQEKLRSASHGGLNVPTTAGIDEALGCAYFIEPAPAGRTLTAHLKAEGRLDSRTAARLLGQLATALRSLHASGGAHRAITADCIYVLPGAGRLTAQLGGFGDGSVPPNSTAIALDDEARLAPEIADGQRGDARADVWALAAVLHQTVDASTHDQLAGLLARCLDDDPAKRPADSTAFLRLLTSPATSRTDEGGVSLDATVEADPELGKRIGDYEVISLLGEGGMGAVYEVRDKSGESFAVKVIRGEGKAPRERRRFLREVRLAGTLQSQNVARVLGSGIDARTGGPFMVMELLHGADVAAVIKREGPIDPSVAARIAADACAGLAEAHEHGLVHRDIKPPNLFLHELDGHIVTKVCDFGIVKDTSLNQANTVLTRTGALIGSPSYMSPEQAQDSSVVDLRTDIWSLSATLYEMLAGVSPWANARNIGEILVFLHAHDVPPLREIAPWVSEGLAAVVHRGLARAREERYPSAGALREALLPFACDEPLPCGAVKRFDAASRPAATPARAVATATAGPRGKGRGPRRFVVPGAIALAGSIALAAAGWRLTQRTPTPMLPPSAVAAVATCELARCIASNGGEPSRCLSDGACMRLETEQCHVLADQQALTNPATIWFGTMLPVRDKDPFFLAFGRSSEQAVDLARRDFTTVSDGLPARAGVGARPIGVIACDDSADARAAARHLIGAGVPAIIGFRSSKDVIQLAQQEFIPNDVLAIAALNTSALITSIPHPANTPRHVFRTAVSNSAAVDAVAGLIDVDVGGARAIGEHQKLLVVRSQDSVGLALSEAIFNGVRFGGIPVGSLGPRFRELSYDFDDHDRFPRLVVSALELLPDVVILHGSADQLLTDFVAPFERGWPKGHARPVYIIPGSIEGDAIAGLLAQPGLAGRLFSMATVFDTPANLKLTNAFNAAFNERLPPSETPGAPYDSFYLLAYAAYASGSPDPRGSDLSRGIARLLPPGKPVDVGPAGILEAFSEIDRGGSIDLQGAYSRMDFDLKTGESPADYAILCTKKGADGKSYEGVASGLVYDAALKKMTGTFNCK